MSEKGPYIVGFRQVSVPFLAAITLSLLGGGVGRWGDGPYFPVEPSQLWVVNLC